MSDKTSAQLKLAWGIKRLEALCWEVLNFENSDAYMPRVERDVRSPEEIEYEVFAIENAAPSPDWPLMAGEIVQSLRAALDHAVWALSTTRHRRISQFPIFVDADDFRVKGLPRIGGVPEPMRALIERAQPYNQIPRQPREDNLAILADLSNTDKHRTLMTVACSVEFTSIGTSAEVDLDWHTPFAPGPLGQDVTVTAFSVRPKAEPFDVNVQPSFTYEVRMEGRPLVRTLVAIAKRVYEVVTECESGQPRPLWAQYPIQQPLPGRHLDGSFAHRRRDSP